MKKGQTESYSFLIGIILTILILTGVGCAAYQIFKPKGKESFDKLISTLQELEKEGIEEQSGEMPIYVEEDEVLIGFGQEQEYLGKEGWFFSGWQCYGIEFQWDILLTPIYGVSGSIDRPGKCPPDSGCLCLCKMKKIVKPKTIPGSPVIYPSIPSVVDEDACQAPDVRCVAFAKLDFIGGKGCPLGVFIPGTKNDKPRELATVYYHKLGDTVSIDDEEAKTFKELEDIAEEKSREEQKRPASGFFNETYDLYDKCQKVSAEDCLCGELDLKKLGEYKIIIEKEEEPVKFKLLDNEDMVLQPEGEKEITLEKDMSTGIVCEDKKANFENECKSVKLTSKGIEPGACCKDSGVWREKTNIYLIKNKEGLYLSLDSRRTNCL